MIRRQLRAMGCARFDLGILPDAGDMMLREGQRTTEIEKLIKWLRHENARGAHIYIRPAGTHSLSLIDDLTVGAIDRVRAEGFEPAVVVETSPNNFQAWLNHGRVLETAMSTRAAKYLAERFGGDPSSADCRHFGRLAGFINPKPERRLPSGLQPFTRLRSATGWVYSRAPEILANIENSKKDETVATEQSRMQHRHPQHVEEGRLNIFTLIPSMVVIFTAPTWRGRSMPPVVVFDCSRSKPRFSRYVISPRKAEEDGNWITCSGPPERPSLG